MISMEILWYYSGWRSFWIIILRPNASRFSFHCSNLPAKMKRGVCAALLPLDCAIISSDIGLVIGHQSRSAPESRVSSPENFEA